jgi:DNA-binding NtrC family response regulator
MYAKRLQAPVPELLGETREALLAYAWPGNIRELENVVHSALLTSREGVIRAGNLRFSTAVQSPSQAAKSGDPLEIIGAQLDRLFASTSDGIFERLEALIVRRAYARTHENQVQTARLLGLSRNVLRTQLKRLGLIP